MNKILFFIILYFFSCSTLLAQNQTNAYQYWFNDDFDAATTVALVPGQTVNLQTDINASHLTMGVHIFYIRFRDNNGLWSSPQAQFVYRMPSLSSGLMNNEIAEYQYWFDDDFDNTINQTITSSSNFQLITGIDAAGLNPGVHIFYIRYKDDRGHWSSPVAQFFYKLPEQVSVQANGVTHYQYWFDNDFNNAVNQTISSSSKFQFITGVDATGLNSGVHIFYLRFKDERGQWSSPVAQFFYKLAIPSGGSLSHDITAYQYWFDGAFDQAVFEPVAGTQNLLLATDIDAGNLQNGVHIFYIRFLNSSGQWSIPATQFIYKLQESQAMNNSIIAYRYWFDHDVDSAQENLVLPSQTFLSLQEEIDMTQMWKGAYTLHYQFKDTLGMWSSPTVDTIEKISLPIAEFSYNRIESCDSTIVDFQNLSIDGDTYFWDFDDGTTSSDSASSHVYYGTGNYNVSLTVTDTLTNADSTVTETIHITGHTGSSIYEVVCDEYLAPSGSVYTSSGIYYDTITNAAMCDSVIQIDLTVLTSTSAQISRHACDSFITPSGQILNSSGIYFDTIANAAGCDSIIEIDLDLGATTFATINENACDSFISPSGNIYTTSGLYHDTILNSSSCDSIIEINLNIKESTSSFQTLQVCDAYHSPAGNIYTTSGVYYDTITNAVMCDSVIQTDLTVLASTSAQINTHACDSFVAPSGQLLYNSGVYFDTITNTAGCDSIIEIDIEVMSIDSSVTVYQDSLYANQDSAIYQWLNCDSNYTAIPGATNQMFLPDNNGNYAVEIQLNGCMKVSECYNISGMYVKSEEFKGVVVFPNPTQGIVNIDFPDIEQNVLVSVYDLTGSLVHHISDENIKQMQFTIDKPKAVYFIRILADNEEYSGKIVIE
ncbi:MAG: T9SS type A sorting domain-containing protein [Bacteroidales bacterium]|nr:T9SS type A sorting domain-containing protein [Bacteroidales bacterium]